jgi:hypothetical protein
MILSEQEKNDLLSQHNNDEILDTLMMHLRRHYPLKSLELSFSPTPKKYIYVNEKMVFLDENKKRLTNLIYWDILDKFRGQPDSILRRTIRRYLTLLGQ